MRRTGLLFLLADLALAVTISDSTSASIAWPDESVGPRTPELISAGKRASKYVACMVCYMQTFQLLHAHANPVEDQEDAEVLSRWLKTSELEETLENAMGICRLDYLAQSLKAAKYALQAKTDGTAELIVGADEGDDWPASMSDDAFNWKAFAIQHACLETFRRDGDKIARAAKETWKRNADQSGAEDEDGGNAVVQRIDTVARDSCFQGKMCRTHVAEQELEKLTTIRDQRKADADPSFAPAKEDFTTPKVVKYDKFIDYYKVLGVEEQAPASEIDAAAKLLSRLYGTAEGVELAGIDEEEARSTMKDIKAARKLLSDRATRRQYDQDRDRLTIWHNMGLSERKPDKRHLDGVATLNAYADEFDELSSRQDL